MDFLEMKFEAGKKTLFFKSKKASIAADPLLTNPLNSCTKLRIRGTFQNKFLTL